MEPATESSEPRPYSVNSVSDVGIEVSDDDLKRLAESFAKGREELQKKIDSLLFLDMLAKKKSSDSIDLATLSFNSPRNIKDEITEKNSTTKGVPITIEQATALRELTVSSCVHRLSSDWTKAKFIFRDRDSELTYGLRSEKNGTKGFILAVQANVIKNMIIKSYSDIKPGSANSRNEKLILRPSEIEKKLYLIETLANILWTAGEKKRACVTINKQSPCFSIGKESDGSGKKSYYVADTITERLHLYEFDNYEKLTTFIKTNIGQFQSAEGCIVYLYSIIMSREIPKIRKELQGEKLLGDMEEGTIALFNLVLNGVAIPYLHNGQLYYDEKTGEELVKPKNGLNSRSDIGILYWDAKEDDKKRTHVESMLKVPRFPIWFSIMGKNQLALMFNTNMSLICDWRFERNFNLHFYSTLLKQETVYKINIDTREEYYDAKKILQLKYQSLHFIDEEKELDIDKLIGTKWPGCEISGTDDLMLLL